MEDQAKYNAQVNRTRLRLFLETEKESCKNQFILSHDTDTNTITVTNPYHQERSIKMSLYAKWDRTVDCDAVIVPDEPEPIKEDNVNTHTVVKDKLSYNNNAILLVLGLFGFWIIIGLLLCGII